MEIIDWVFRGYFLLLLLRLSIADTGQAAFNRAFQFVVKATDPALRMAVKFLPRRGRSAALWFCLFLIVFLRGLFFLAAAEADRVFDFSLLHWNFNLDHGLWWLGKSFVYFFALIFQFYAFIFSVQLLWPAGVPGEELKRLIDLALVPLRLDRWKPAGLFTAASLFLGVLWAWFGFAGLLMGSAPRWWLSPFLAAALVVRLIPATIGLVIVAVILNWLRVVGVGRWSSYGLESLAEVFLRPFRPLRLRVGAFDLTPLVVVIVLLFMERLLMLMLEGFVRLLT